MTTPSDVKKSSKVLVISMLLFTLLPAFHIGYELWFARHAVRTSGIVVGRMSGTKGGGSAEVEYVDAFGVGKKFTDPNNDPYSKGQHVKVLYSPTAGRAEVDGFSRWQFEIVFGAPLLLGWVWVLVAALTT